MKKKINDCLLSAIVEGRQKRSPVSLSNRLMRNTSVQTFKIMKLLTLFLFLALSSGYATGFAQQVTISGKNLSLNQVFALVEKQTGYVLFSNSATFRKAKKVSLKAVDMPLRDFLDAVLKEQPLEYLILGKTITLTDKLHEAPEPEKQVVADTGRISGRVTDAAGTPLSGATVLVKGRQRSAVTTAASGHFEIRNAAVSDVLIISFIGYATQEFVVRSQDENIIRLLLSDSQLDDIVVVGYGSQKKKNVTGSIAKIQSSEFKNAVITTVDQSLQGRASGVQVVSTSGEPGAEVVVRIRGINSLSGDNQPLYVIDGFVMPPYREASASGTSGSYASNGLYGLDVNDIESIDILKDAAATAIYGSRAANGVVLITTKKGKAGESKIELVSKTSFGTISNPIEMMNSYEYATIKNQTFLAVNQTAPFDLDSIPVTGNTNWLNEISRTGVRQETSINYRGGVGNTNYFLSGSYLIDEGVLKKSNNKRGSVRFNLNSKLKNWYDIRIQMTGTRQRQTRAVTESRGWPFVGGPLFDALRSAPLQKNNNELVGNQPDIINGVALSGYSFINPLQELTEKTDFTYNDQFIANAENIFSLDRNKQLKLHVVVGTSFHNSQRMINLPNWLGSARSVNGLASQSMAKTQAYNSSLYLSHNFSTGGLSFSSTGGVEYANYIVSLFNALGRGINFPAIGLDAMESAQNQSISSYKEESVIRSGFFRENLSFKDRYVLSVSMRADGASKFADNRKWGYFPSVAAAWNLEQENFMSAITNLDNAKIRVSYGLTGSQSLPAYRSQRRYTTSFYELGNNPGGGSTVTTLVVAQPNNPELKWETTSQFNIGTDISLGKGFLTLTFDYYNKLTSDLLQSMPIPAQSGYRNIWANNGTMRNRGVEVNLGLKPFRGKVEWSTNLIYSNNKTMVVDLGKFDPTSQGLTSLGGSLLGGGASILIPGQPLGQFFGYKVIGLYQKEDLDASGKPTVALPANVNDNFEGRFKYQDTDSNGVINSKDRMILGNAQPKFTFGWNNNISWKRWNLNVFFNGSVGNDIVNVSGAYLRTGILNLAGVGFNQTKDWYENRYTAERPTNDPRYPAAQPQPNGGYLSVEDVNSTMIEDGSFVRLKSLTLSYKPKLRTKVIGDLAIYFTTTNVLTLTRYSGFDPEVSSYGANVRLQGIDYAAYPNYKSYTIGLNFSL